MRALLKACRSFSSEVTQYCGLRCVEFIGVLCLRSWTGMPDVREYVVLCLPSDNVRSMSFNVDHSKYS